MQFQWGNILFDGVITSHQEVFDFFSPSGVPLRSKVSLTLTEQNFVYTVNADDVARATAAPSPSTARDLAAANGDDSLFDLGPGGLSLGFSANLSLGISLDASASFSAQLGLSADFGVSLDAGISLDASAAVDVFGSAALNIGGGSGDVGQAGLASFAPTPKPPAGVTPPASPWAPDGPTARIERRAARLRGECDARWRGGGGAGRRPGCARQHHARAGARLATARIAARADHRQHGVRRKPTDAAGNASAASICQAGRRCPATRWRRRCRWR